MAAVLEELGAYFPCCNLLVLSTDLRKAPYTDSSVGWDWMLFKLGQGGKKEQLMLLVIT